MTFRFQKVRPAKTTPLTRILRPGGHLRAAFRAKRLSGTLRSLAAMQQIADWLKKLVMAEYL